MGYAGSSELADALENALESVPRGPRTRAREEKPEPEARGPRWTGEALAELEEIPAFLRGRARRLAEDHAQAVGSSEVTPRILEESRS